MKNTNLVPELSQELQNRLQPFMPMTIVKDPVSGMGYRHSHGKLINQELWKEVCDYLDYLYNPKNLVHFLSDDLLQILQDYSPVRIYRNNEGPYYTLYGKNLSVEILTNGDYKSDSPAIDSIDGKIWRAIARELNEACSKSKVDEFAKDVIQEQTKEIVSHIDGVIKEVDAFINLLEVMKLPNITITQYSEIINFIRKTVK